MRASFARGFSESSPLAPMLAPMLEITDHSALSPASGTIGPALDGPEDKLPSGHSPERGRADPSDRLLAEGRDAMVNRLFARYGRGTARLQLRYLWKKYAFLGVVEGAVILKRALDLGIGALVMIPALPLGLVVAGLIKATDGGPVFYVQRRVGRHGREFAFPKFRSMVVEADRRRAELLATNQHGARGVTFKLKRDPRITWIGRITRRASIDELPQLWCVLMGEMSLVGPRPPLPEEVARYSLRERRRLDVKPGLTCFWQVEGRADLNFDEQVRLDIAYLESQSLLLDLRLLARTIPAVMLGRGAY